MDLLADVQTRMTAEPPKCTPPAQLTGSDFEVLHKNAIDIAVAALLCGSTRVVAYHCYQGSPSLYDEETFHAWAHDDASKHAPMQNWRYRQFAHLVAAWTRSPTCNGQHPARQLSRLRRQRALRSGPRRRVTSRACRS